MHVRLIRESQLLSVYYSACSGNSAHFLNQFQSDKTACVSGRCVQSLSAFPDFTVCNSGCSSVGRALCLSCIFCALCGRSILCTTAYGNGNGICVRISVNRIIICESDRILGNNGSFCNICAYLCQPC